MLDHNVLKAARTNLHKEAFNPMTPEAQAAAAQQGAAPPPAGAAPPMDPAMMGAAPPMDPAMMGAAPPMDPAMMGAAPPMDPAMMGGAPPMDPAMMGMDPAAMGMPEDPAAAGTPVTLNLEDLKAVLQEISGEGGAEEETSKRATNRQIMDELAGLKEVVSALAAAQGIQLPAGDVGAGAGTEPSTEAANPEDIAAVAAEMGGAEGGMPMDPMSEAMAMGLPPGEMPPGAMPKMALDQWSNTKAGRLADRTH